MWTPRNPYTPGAPTAFCGSRVLSPNAILLERSSVQAATHAFNSSVRLVHLWWSILVTSIGLLRVFGGPLEPTYRILIHVLLHFPPLRVIHLVTALHLQVVSVACPAVTVEYTVKR